MPNSLTGKKSAMEERFEALAKEMGYEVAQKKEPTKVNMMGEGSDDDLLGRLYDMKNEGNELAEHQFGKKKKPTSKDIHDAALDLKDEEVEDRTPFTDTLTEMAQDAKDGRDSE